MKLLLYKNYLYHKKSKKFKTNLRKCIKDPLSILRSSLFFKLSTTSESYPSKSYFAICVILLSSKTSLFTYEFLIKKGFKFQTKT